MKLPIHAMTLPQSGRLYLILLNYNNHLTCLVDVHYMYYIQYRITLIFI